MNKGHPDFLGLRVLNDDTGAVLIPELAHGRQTKWEVRALQQGMPGSSTLGTFKVVAPGGPYSPEFRRIKSQWDLLQQNWANEVRMRVEGYLGGRVTGTPRFSGIVTGMTPSLDAPWELSGIDSFWLLQQSQVLPGETALLSGNWGSVSAPAFYGTEEVVWDDDFTGWNGPSHKNSSDYTNSGFSFNAADPLLGLPNLTASAAGSRAITNTTWSSLAQFIAAAVTIHGVATAAAGVSTGNAVSPGIFIQTDPTGANGLFVQCALSQTAPSTGLYNVSCAIYSVSGGTNTNQALVNNVFTNVTSPFPFELTAVVGFEPTGGAGGQVNFVKVLLNGKDPSCVLLGLVIPGTGSGGVGVRQGDTLGQVYVNRMQFHARTSGNPGFLAPFGTNRFRTGALYRGAFLGQNVVGNGQTHLDVLQLVSAFDGVSVRRDPGAGYKSDTIQYGGGVAVLSPGTDYSSSIVLKEGVNIDASDTQVAAVPEMLGSDVRLNSLPGADSGGSVTWGRIGRSGDAVLTDTIADVGIPGFQLLVKYARAIQARKVNPLQAIQARVVRDDRWIGAPGTNGAGPREWDSVFVAIPTLNVPMQVAQIVGYDFEEGQETMIVYFNQLPAKAAPLAATGRIQRQLDNLGTTYQQR